MVTDTSKVGIYEDRKECCNTWQADGTEETCGSGAAQRDSETRHDPETETDQQVVSAALFDGARESGCRFLLPPTALSYNAGAETMNDHDDKRVPILLWPFHAVWRLLTLVLELVGRLLCGVLGLALMAAGVAVTITVLAAPVGIPIAALGFLLLVRAIF